MAIPSSRNFASCYMELCKQQRLRPLPVICVTLPYSLDFTTDRVKMDDWGPILNSLTLDRSLKSISVRSRYQCRKPLDEINSEDKARAMTKAPVVLTRYLLEWISHSIGQCIRNSSSLTTLELEGMPFPPDCIAVLCVGITNTETLHHLSLQRCYIGDNGCELICRTIADVQSLKSLNLSFCDLTLKSGSTLAAALSRQKLSLYHDTWKQSLRYQEPNLEAMPGLRRLTLNDNPHLGDSAVMELIDAIRDSLWLKALDVQRCGLSDRIAKDLLELLDHNSTLMILDVRQNPNLNEEIVQEIIKRLDDCSAEGKSEYKWSGLPRKDRRTASAGCVRRKENENIVKTPVRPRSSTACNVKRRCQTTSPSETMIIKKPSWKPPPAPVRSRRTVTRPQAPLFQDTLNQQKREKQQQIVKKLQLRSKTLIHLDLQSRIQPLMAKSSAEDHKVLENNVESTRNVSPRSLTSEKIDAATQMMDNFETVDSAGFQNILKELDDAKTEHDRLLEETRRSDLLLMEERGRREATEAKLRTMKKNLDELESALREKEIETKGFLLLSQQSLDEICSSFDRLLELFESVARNPVSSKKESSEAAIVKADIKRRVASVIRKTKSENLRRGYVIDVDEIESPRCAEAIKIFAKSESDMKTALPPLSTMHLERNIGDSPDVISSPLERKPTRRHDFETLPMTSVERARALFARIINGDTLLDFRTHDDSKFYSFD